MEQGELFILITDMYIPSYDYPLCHDDIMGNYTLDACIY